MKPRRHQVVFRCALCLFACAAVLSPQLATADARLNTDVVPTFEAITLKLDAGQIEYTGTANFELDVKTSTDRFNFHAEGMRLDKLTVTQSGKDIPAEFTPGEHATIDVHTAALLKVGAANMTVAFTNWVDTTGNSLHRVIDDDQSYIFTQFEPDDAREAFPCWDEPSFKNPFQMTLIIPEAHTAVFNTPVENEATADGWKTIVFKRTKPLPAYLLAIAIGPLESVPIPGMSIPGRIVTCKGKSGLAGEAVSITPPVVAALEKYFGQKYPYEKLDLIAVPGMGGAMENAGAVTFGDGLLLVDPSRVTVSHRRSLAAVTAHELAHMWFGDLVTLAWWDDTWLNESFASWMGDKITEEVFPEYGMDISRVRGAQNVMESDARATTRAIRRPVEATDNLDFAFDGLAYEKGETVLGMFEQWLGPETFRKGVLDYLNQHAWGTANAQDFWSALSRASGKDIAATLAPYFDKPGVPLVTADVTLDGRVKLSQQRFANYGTELDPVSWNIPVVLKYSDGTGPKTQSVLLDEAEKTVDLTGKDGDIAWLLPDGNTAGYYRWSVSPDMLAKLAAHTNDLKVGERVDLIGNLSALLDAGTISGDNFLRTLNNFADDPNPEVISTMLSALGGIREAFVTDANEDAFAGYVRRTLGPSLQRFGIVQQEGETETVTRFRPQLIGWLGDEGKDPQINAYADSMAGLYFQNPDKVDPQLASTFLALSAAHGNQALFDECRKRFETAEIPADRSRYLRLLGDFRDPALINEALTYAVTGPLRPREFFGVAFGAMSYRDNEDMVFQWILDHYDEIMAKLPPESGAFMPFIASGCSRARIQKAQEFFSQPEHSVAGTDERLARVMEQVNDCTSLRDREGAVVDKYIREFAAAAHQ